MSAADVISLYPAFIVEHAAPLVVVVPLIAAALAAMTPGQRPAWLITLGATGASTLLAILLLAQTMTQGVVSYALGGWVAPIGIEYRVDQLNAMILLLVGVFGFLCALYAPRSVDDEIPQSMRGLFYSCFLVCFTGLMGVAITGDAFNLFVFLEISSLSTYVLVGIGSHRDRRALTASYNYLILGTIGATFFVLGVGFLYAATGTLNIADMAERLSGLEASSTVRAGFAFIVVGLGLKVAMYPLHSWLPNAYTFAPSVVTAFLASTATKVAFYALVRFFYSVFDPGFVFEGAFWIWLVAPLGVIAMLAASVQAVFQTDIRRLFAFSSVAQVGYMLLGLSFGTAAGLGAGLLHLLNHAMMKGALFMAIGAAALRFGVMRIEEFRGLGRTMPFTMAAFTIAGLSLIGVPLTAGFVSKFALLNAALERGWWWAVVAIAVSSILALIYVGRIIEAAYLKAPPTRDGVSAARAPAPLSMLIPLWTLALANVWFGVNAGFTTSLACNAAMMLTGDGVCIGPGAAP